MNERSFGPVKQIGYLVENVEQSIKAWMKHAGVGPWLIIKNIPLDCQYKGEVSQPLIDIGIAYSGDVQIELIQQKNEEPSPYLKYFEEKRFGQHHTAFLSDDINADIERAVSQGLEVVCDIKMFDGSRYVYMQSPLLGDDVFLEFIENTDMMQAMFKSGIEKARSWNGEEDISVMDLATG